MTTHQSAHVAVLEALIAADALCNKSDKLDRERVMGRIVVRHWPAVLAALTAIPQAAPEGAELLPCPFCGGEPKLAEVEPSGYVVECTNGACNASTNIRLSCGEDARPLVREQWNRRRGASPQVQGGEAVAERQQWIEAQLDAADRAWCKQFGERWDHGDDVPSHTHFVSLWLAERLAAPVSAPPEKLSPGQINPATGQPVKTWPLRPIREFVAAPVSAVGDGLQDEIRWALNGLPTLSRNLLSEGQTSRAVVVSRALELIRNIAALPSGPSGVDGGAT